MISNELTEEQLRALFTWIDAIPLSRPKRNITRDFSDGVLLAEVVHAYFPHLVELHNYASTSSIKQKIYNFDTLNKKVFKKLGYVITRELIEDVVNCKPGAIEIVLNALQLKMASYREKRISENSSVEVRSGRVSNEKDGYPSGQKGKIAEQIVNEKDNQIRELQETIEILDLKVSKLEQLIRLKDLKIQKLSQINSS
jgi:hypothetical protein